MKIFISHETSDYKEIKPIIESIYRIFGNKFRFFNSSEKFDGSNPKDDVKTNIDRELTDADFVLIFATPNFICSEYCLYEVSVASFLKKPVYIFNFNQKSADVIAKIIGKNLVYIDCLSSEKAELSFANFAYSVARDYDVGVSKEEISHHLENSFNSSKNLQRKRMFIGASQEIINLENYSNKMGIYEFRNTTIDMDTLHDKLVNVKELYIVSTTGYDLISKLSVSIFKELLESGTKIFIFNAKTNSEFLKDIAIIENAENSKENLRRLNDEINGGYLLVNEVLNSVSDKCKGEIRFYPIKTLLRQTATLAIYNDDSTWGWMLTTIPPNRTRDNTPFFMFKNCCVDEGMSKIIFSHIKGLIKTNSINASINQNVSYDEDKWMSLLDKANLNFLNDFNDPDKEGILIEIAAQHPLKSDGTPGSEFQERLNRGFQLYNEFKNNEEVYIYIPGSCHDDSGVSLSDAGKKYLLAKGIPESHVYGDAIQEEIMNNKGVYNSFEECFVTYSIYKQKNFRKVFSVCSPYQMSRKILFYILLGIVVEAIPVYCRKMWHNIIKENFEDIPFLLQNPDVYKKENYFESIVFLNARKERKH